MGQITIDIPQNVNRKYRIVSENSAKEFLLYLESLTKEQVIIEIYETGTTQTDREE